MSSFREFLKTLTNELDRHGLRNWVEQGGKHKKLHIQFRKPQFLTIPSTPSDPRGIKNALSRLRRMIREAAEAPVTACLGRHANGYPACA